MMHFDEPIYVTRPILPPLDVLQEKLAEVWRSQWLTNGGRQHDELEEAIRSHLQVPHLSLFNNGTIALLAALRGLGLTGDVITTPFTFPATPHSLTWSGITPVFADIDPVRMTVDPEQVEALITPRTTGILAVHVYGIPCDVDRLKAIADRHGLKIVYDAAHAFGVRIGDTSIGNFGDASMFSFHATKLFHTGEGGALVARREALKVAFDRFKNFGIVNQEEVDVVGINGKMNELQAALGLAVLDCVADEVRRRRAIVARYRERLARVPGLTLMPELPGVTNSYQYFVIRIDERLFGCSRDWVFDELRRSNVLTRKYFYPLCTDYECYRGLPSAAPGSVPTARRVATEVLCLPLYGALPLEAVDTICELMIGIQVRA